MAIPRSKLTLSAIAGVASIAILAAQSTFAASQNLDNITVTTVAVNGGTDTQNPGTTCITVSVPLLAACEGGYVAIQNNNQQLLAAALQAKATSSNVRFYYDASAGPFHCPGRVFTPCSVISIEIK